MNNRSGDNDSGYPDHPSHPQTSKTNKTICCSDSLRSDSLITFESSDTFVWPRWNTLSSLACMPVHSNADSSFTPIDVMTTYAFPFFQRIVFHSKTTRGTSGCWVPKRRKFSARIRVADVPFARQLASLEIRPFSGSTGSLCPHESCEVQGRSTISWAEYFSNARQIGR